MTAKSFAKAAGRYDGTTAKIRSNKYHEAVFVLAPGGQFSRLRSTAKNHDMKYKSKTADMDDGGLYLFVPK